MKYVSKLNFMPILEQNGQEVSLEQLSSGNLFLIERIILLLRQMYSCSIVNNIPVSDIIKIPGVLLIDEAENHLHPKWQKLFINIVHDFFPEFQIILTTHSPFIVSSVKDPKIYVCEAKNGYSEITDYTNKYSNMPIDEILTTPIFNTKPFNKEISDLLEKRKCAILIQDIDTKMEIEEELLRLNPEYFTFYNLGGKIEFYDNEIY